MKELPRTWPDGRPVGGLNGYPPEYVDWNIECQCRYVARQMLEAGKGQREAVFQKWQTTLCNVTRPMVGAALKALSADRGATMQQQRNERATRGERG